MYFSDSLTRTRHFHDRILAVVFSWPIVSSTKVGHGNETKCFGISRQFFHPNKKIFLDSLRPKQKKIFLDSSTQTKKRIFSDSSTRTRHFHDQILAVVFSLADCFINKSR